MEFPDALIPDGVIRDQILGRIERFEAGPDGGYAAKISYAVEVAGGELTQLLNTVFGNISIKPGIRVESLELPDRGAAAFCWPAELTWTAKPRCFCRMICGSGLDPEPSRRGARQPYRAFHPGCRGAAPITDFGVNDRGSGSEQYPPRMMRALLIDCYATGRFGSRTIEAASDSDVAVRDLCSNHHPDHDSICTFRAANKQAFKAAFVSGLQLAQHLRLSKVGTVSVDGTKLQANASKHAAVSYARAGELIAQLELEVQDLIGRAQQAENQETKEALDIPAELTRREDRKAALQQARQVIEIRAKEMTAAQQADYRPSKLVAYVP